jgi:hypothetical protein
MRTAGGWPFSTKPAGQQYPVQGAFNPRVAGSNPARPTGRLRGSEGLFTLPGRQANHRGPALAPHWPRICHEPSRFGRSRCDGASIEGVSPLRASQEVPRRCFATDALGSGGVGRIGSRTLASSGGGALPGGSTHHPPRSHIHTYAHRSMKGAQYQSLTHVGIASRRGDAPFGGSHAQPGFTPEGGVHPPGDGMRSVDASSPCDCRPTPSILGAAFASVKLVSGPATNDRRGLVARRPPAR